MAGSRRFAARYLPTVLALIPFMAESAEDVEQVKILAACPRAAAWQDAHPKINFLELKATRQEAASNPRLQSELSKRAAWNQQARQTLSFESGEPSDAAVLKLKRVDQRDLRFLQGLIRRDGDVPSAMSVGESGMHAFWLLVQHADLDPSLQSRVLEVLKRKREQVPLDEMALLEDRVRVNEARPQLYGTQFKIQSKGSQPNAQQELQMQPVEDESRLDERRADMDLMPLQDYQCVLRAV